MKETLQSLILQYIGPLKPSSKSWKTRNCMMCQSRGYSRDTRNRFGIHFLDGVTVNCFNCGFSGHYEDGGDLSIAIKTFLKAIGVDEPDIKQLEFEAYKVKYSLEDTTKKPRVIKSLSDKWPPAQLPEQSQSLKAWADVGCIDDDFLSVLEYAISRKLDALHQFYWTPITLNQLNKRIIIPYYYRKNIVGFTSRYVGVLSDKKIAKYYQKCPEDFVYNLDAQILSRKYVVVTEGVLDAWAVDGVGILGEMNQSKADTINRLQKETIVCPDRDIKGGQLVEVAIRNNWGVAFPRWDNDIKDASQAAQKYGRLLTLHSIMSTVVTNRSSISIKWAIEQNERDKN